MTKKTIKHSFRASAKFRKSRRKKYKLLSYDTKRLNFQLLLFQYKEIIKSLKRFVLEEGGYRHLVELK